MEQAAAPVAYIARPRRGNMLGWHPERGSCLFNFPGDDARHIGERDGSLGNSADLAEAIAYCYRKADALSAQLGKRVGCVVNLSMGFNGGSHDGESLVERVIDVMLEGKGRALVVAAGNQRQQRTYFTDAIRRDTPYALRWKMGLGTITDSTLNELEIWYLSNHVAACQAYQPRKWSDRGCRAWTEQANCF